MKYNENIKDLTYISKIKKLEILDMHCTNITNISFLENNKNIKKLYIHNCNKFIKKDNIFKRKDINIYLD